MGGGRTFTTTVLEHPRHRSASKTVGGGWIEKGRKGGGGGNMSVFLVLLSHGRCQRISERKGGVMGGVMYAVIHD